MSITRKLIEEGGKYYKENPQQLYLDLKESDSWVSRIRGLGEVFRQKTRHSLINKALKIDDEQQTVTVENFDELMNLAIAFKTGSPKEKIKKNPAKANICLALIYCEVAGIKKLRKTQERALRLLQKTRNKEIRELLRNLSPRQSQSITKDLNTKNLVHSNEEIAPLLVTPSDFDNEELNDENDIDNETSRLAESSSIEEKPDTISDTSGAEKSITLIPSNAKESSSVEFSSAAVLPSSAAKNDEPVQPHTQKAPLDSYTHLLNTLNQQGDKKYQHAYFIAEIKKFKHDELKKLLDHMIGIQNGEKDTTFSEIRRERFYPWKEGNTKTWQKIISQVKETIIDKLDKATLDEQERNNYYQAMNTHTSRLRFFDCRRTKHATQFAELFINQHLKK